ncbi:MAG: YfhO family protein [Desulfobacterales bacterium]|nr:YfhO family protein [Desulfobacterales bacterium]
MKDMSVFSAISRKKIKNYGYIFIAIASSLLFFYPLILSNKTFFFRDIHRWFYPMKYFLASSLKAGSIPFWCPNYFCGSPFMSDLQSGVFYPISLVFVLFPFSWSFNIYIILHFFLGFCFFYHFIKGIGLSKGSALITSISYCYGGYAIASVSTLNNLSTMIWLPAILWSFQKAATKGHKSGYFFTVLFLCMSILGGEPQLFILTAGLVFFYGLTSVADETHGISSRIKNTAIILIVITSSVLLTMVQLGPAYMDYQLSARLGGIAYEEATEFSLNLQMLKHLVLPLHFSLTFTTDPAALNNFFPGKGQMPWLLTIYPGFMIVPMAIFGLFFGFSKRILFWLVTFFITLALALGHNTPAYYIFFKIFPFFRFPEKFMFLAGFSLLVMAAYGFDRIFCLFRQKSVRPGLLLFFMALTVFADLYVTHKNLNPLCESAFLKSYHPGLQPVLDDPEPFRIYVDNERTSPDFYQNTIFNHHITWQKLLMPNLGILHNLNHVGGTSGLELRYQYLITEMLLKPWPEKVRFLRLANVKYIISLKPLDKNPDLKGQIEKINAIVYKIRGYLPRAWIVGQLHPIRKGTMDELIDGSFNPEYSAIAKGKIADRYNKPFFKKIDDIRYENDGRINIELNADEPGVLVISESSYPGWQVFVDRQKKECLWLNLLFQGVEIEKGKHEICFLYRPRHFNLFLSISLISSVLFSFIWLFCLSFGKNRH